MQWTMRIKQKKKKQKPKTEIRPNSSLRESRKIASNIYVEYGLSNCIQNC